jgi:hypothetical protein
MGCGMGCPRNCVLQISSKLLGVIIRPIPVAGQRKDFSGDEARRQIDDNNDAVLVRYAAGIDQTQKLGPGRPRNYLAP